MKTKISHKINTIDLKSLSSTSSIPFIGGILSIFSENASNGVESFDKDTQRFLIDKLPTLKTSPSSVDMNPYTSSFSMSQSLPSVYKDQQNFANSTSSEGWSSSTLGRVIPSSYEKLETDSFSYSGEGTNASAEMQEDAAPSDPTTLDRLSKQILLDQSEQDKNLSGGITDADHIGVEDANAEGSGDIDLDGLKPPLSSQPEQNQNGMVDVNALSNIGNIAGSPDKEDVTGDIGIDSAVQSNLRAISEASVSMKPFVPISSPNTIPSNSNSNGVSSNTDTKARSILEDASQKLKSFNAHVSALNDSNMQVYIRLKNIESELFSIDNIVVARDLILTPDEKRNKANNRISRLQGVKNLLLDLIDTHPTSPLVAVSLALHYECDAMLLSMQKWKENPSSNLPLNMMSSFITPTSLFTAASLEKHHEKYQSSIKRASEFYSKVVDSYQDSDASERDASKILKFDNDVSPNHTPFNIKMKQLFNNEVQSSLMIQRKTRNALKSKTLLSSYNAQKASDRVSTKLRTKQSINTVGINTDSANQKYERRPAGSKTNSRRLNLLDTPVAVKNRDSVPYVNEYEKTKRLFS